MAHNHGRWCVFRFSKDSEQDKTARQQRMGSINKDTWLWNLWGRALKWCLCWNKALSVQKTLPFMININGKKNQQPESEQNKRNQYPWFCFIDYLMAYSAKMLRMLFWKNKKLKTKKKQCFFCIFHSLWYEDQCNKQTLIHFFHAIPFWQIGKLATVIPEESR